MSAPKGIAPYWVEPGRLLAGAYPGSPDPAHARLKLAWLRGQGVRSFVDLTEPGEATRLGRLVPYAPLLAEAAGNGGPAASYLRLPIPDLSVPTRAGMRALLDRVDRDAGEGRPVYLHCLGGRGRTGTVVACWLVRHSPRLLGAADPEWARERALRAIVELRREHGVPDPEGSPETAAQFALVRTWGVGE